MAPRDTANESHSAAANADDSVELNWMERAGPEQAEHGERVGARGHRVAPVVGRSHGAPRGSGSRPGAANRTACTMDASVKVAKRQRAAARDSKEVSVESREDGLRRRADLRCVDRPWAVASCCSKRTVTNADPGRIAPVRALAGWASPRNR